MSGIDTSAEGVAADLEYLRLISDVEHKSPEGVIHDRYEALAAERDRLREALDYAFKEMTGAYSAIDGHFSASEIELDQSIADAHAGLHVAMHTAAIALKETGQ